MIYIIDNGEGVDDHDIHFLEVTDDELELFEKALIPLIETSHRFGFLIGTTSYVNWKNRDAVLDLSDFINLNNLFKRQSNGNLQRRRDVPMLTDSMIDKIFKWRPTTENDFAFYIGNNLHHFSWDEVRRALSETP